MARKADQDTATADVGTPDESFYDFLLNEGTEVDKTQSGSLLTVHIPDGIHEQVARLDKIGKAKSFPVTDEQRFLWMRAVYIPAAQKINRSATVTKSFNTVKGADGQVISREWVATRVSIGDKRGVKAGSTNGAAPDNTGTPEQVQEAAHEIHRGW